ncbi:MAG TPA: lytic transglycosylase domain-containing protein [Streptosporangiaceae bacterium]
MRARHLRLGMLQRTKRRAAVLVSHHGWSRRNFICLDLLWMRESGWDHHAYNRFSGAYGIPQAVPGGRMRSAGRDWRTNPRTQVVWGIRYIEQRYGSPCRAWWHSRATGWY